MISLTCTTCRNVLSIDDAFAGGVCRCQHCGTIQTVPTHLKGGGTSTSEPKTLYKHRSRAESASGTGLHELADIVASSGLARSGLRENPPGPATPAQPPEIPQPPVETKPDRSRSLLFAAAGIIAALIGVIIWLTLHA